MFSQKRTSRKTIVQIVSITTVGLLAANSVFKVFRCWVFLKILVKQDLMDESAAAESVAVAREWGRDHGALEVMGISSATGLGLGELKKLLLIFIFIFSFFF